MPSLRNKPIGRQTKLQAACAQLTDMAHRLGPEAKMPTVLELRQALGVSVATVNSALNELEGQNVVDRKHGVGIYVSSRLHHKAISLICDPSFFRVAGASPFWNMLIHRVRDRAAAEQEELSLHFATALGDRDPPLHEGLIGEIRDGRVHGILGIGLCTPLAEWIMAQRVPLVAFAGHARWTVGLDGPEIMRLAVKKLAEQGCRRIGLWKPVAPFRPQEANAAEQSEQTEAFLQALAQRGLALDRGLIKVNRHLITGSGSQTTETHQEQGYRTALEVFGAEAGARPDGVVSADDMMTQGALIALQKLGVRVGEEVRIATHGNVGSPVLLGHEAALTVIEIDPAEVVRAMFAMLETLMEGRIPREQIVLIKPRIMQQRRGDAP